MTIKEHHWKPTDLFVGGCHKALLYVILIAAVAILVLAYISTKSPYSKTTILAIQLTDPPGVPQGTQHLLITYSSVQVHVSNSNQSGWVSAVGNGTVDLMLLLNATRTIANANVAANSTVNLVRFSITSARIVINNNTYNVTTPNSQINIAVTGSQKISTNSSAAVLIDLFPKVNAVGGASSNTYILVPAARAVVVNANSSISVNTNIGSIGSINGKARVGLGLNLT